VYGVGLLCIVGGSVLGRKKTEPLTGGRRGIPPRIIRAPGAGKKKFLVGGYWRSNRIRRGKSEEGRGKEGFSIGCRRPGAGEHQTDHA